MTKSRMEKAIEQYNEMREAPEPEKLKTNTSLYVGVDFSSSSRPTAYFDLSELVSKPEDQPHLQRRSLSLEDARAITAVRQRAMSTLLIKNMLEKAGKLLDRDDPGADLEFLLRMFHKRAANPEMDWNKLYEADEDFDFCHDINMIIKETNDKFILSPTCLPRFKKVKENDAE